MLILGRLMSFVATLFVCSLSSGSAQAEDGHELWLRYRPPTTTAAGHFDLRARLSPQGGSPTIQAATAELTRALGAMSGDRPQLTPDGGPGTIVYGTPAASARISQLGLDLSDLGHDGYLIARRGGPGREMIVVTGNSDIGVLYGVFELLRRMQTGENLDDGEVRSSPRLQRRLLNHWDNLDRTVERGYAGQSIWDWQKLPDFRDPIYVDYARANASIGINGAVLNNVNASGVSLTAPYIAKAAALADVFRPYGLKVYLTARFSAPIEVGGLATADPLDPGVRAWWAAKADEIYAAIPDFGGFLVKANSEGQPGPQDYGRSHADGANMLADALTSHGGVVMWRAFVYSHTTPDDRAKQAFDEFIPLDGQFRDNVIVQVKNGPIDFQPREPFHPMFGAMPRTPLMMEVQITKEYLGFATHLAYLGPLYQEVLASDTHRPGPGATVARVLEGTRGQGGLTGMAGVANIGSDRNWTGSQFDQANWYVFGRMAWDPEISSTAVAQDWVRRTFTSDPAFVEPVVGMMMGSRQAVVDYMTPLGLHHLMATGHHYGPGPWVSDLARPEWNPVYYHQANAAGIGFDRTVTGSNAVSQYAPDVAAAYSDLATVGDADLLWFHHLPWDYRMRSGRTLWNELVTTYGQGVDQVVLMRSTWAGLARYIDPERHAEVAAFLAIQEKEARWWRDASISYFQSKSQRPLPAGVEPPPHPLDWYEALTFPFAPGN
jgi:alpha-glucuronidase